MLQWQSGYYSSSGQYQTYADAICTIDGFAINAGKTIVAKSTVTCEIDFNFFNANGTQLSMTQEAGITSKTANAPTNCAYVQISFRAVGIDTSKISVTIDGRTSVVLHTLTFPSPISLKSAGAVHQIYYPETGEMTEPLRTVTFNGTEGWLEYSGAGTGYKGARVTLSTETNGRTNIINNMGFIPQSSPSGSTIKGISTIGSTLSVTFPTTEYATWSDFVDSLASNPLVVTYALATPDPDTYVDPILDNYVKVEPNGTVKAVQSQSPEIDSAMTVEYMAS